MLPQHIGQDQKTVGFVEDEGVEEVGHGGGQRWRGRQEDEIGDWRQTSRRQTSFFARFLTFYVYMIKQGGSDTIKDNVEHPPTGHGGSESD
jgi:hypothetical protein